MKDVFKHLAVGNKTYPFVFNLNVIQAISARYGKKDGLTKWADLVQPTDGSEPDIEALIFFCKEAINEGIDMENDPEDSHYIRSETPRAFITEKQAGRIISTTEDFGAFAIDTVVESNNNGAEKNLTTEQNPNLTAE